MLQLHFPHHESEAAVVDLVGAKNAPLSWLRLQHFRLGNTVREHRFDTGDSEYVLDIFGGCCTVEIMARSGAASFREVGARPNVFAGKPTMIYLPRDSRAAIFSESDNFEGALVSAPADESFPPVVVYPEENLSRQIGKDNWARTVHTAVGENVLANRLIVGETLNPPGNWSSSPPHKHDKNLGDERRTEEVYMYKLNPVQGFGLQRVYTAADDPDPFDVTYAVRNNDVVVLPRGYHPVVAAPGYQLFYLWALAGDERTYGAWSDDPDHAWIKGLS